MVIESANYQAGFHARWAHLHQPVVRSLAWLLDAPLLLNVRHPRWTDQLARIPEINDRTKNWLAELDQHPAPLLEFLAVHPHTRLGHFAENLLAFYFQWSGELVAHSVQVRANTTIGEFDFLLNTPYGFEHWEFACKFYLFLENGRALSDFVGPNLMDNLNDKSHKIMDLQLRLGQHPEAQKYLPQPLRAARALLKGWLFYPIGASTSPAEIEPTHCRGTWCRLSALEQIESDRMTILERLSWLAPAMVTVDKTMSQLGLFEHLKHRFAKGDTRPVLTASLTMQAGVWVEEQRIFVVPDDWNR